MNGLEKITERIRAEGEAEIAAIRNQGTAHAEEISASFRQQALEIERQAAAERAEAAQQRRERLQSAAAMEGRQAQLKCKQECIDEAFRQAGDVLRALPEQDYIALLARLAASNGDGTEEIVLSAADRARVGAAVTAMANDLKPGAGFVLSDETRELAGGLILKKGRVERNCAFDTQLHLLRQEMASQIAGILFRPLSDEA